MGLVDDLMILLFSITGSVIPIATLSINHTNVATMLANIALLLTPTPNHKLQALSKAH